MLKEMSVKGDLKCVFNMPEKLDSQFDGNEEEYHGLPPYAPVETYPVDEYEACPTNWTHGSDTTSSYFVGVKKNYGMWLDFNECFYHTHDVAVVISIQGINPITGQKMVANKALKLEQYHKKCPIHNVNFKQDRFCEKCGFKWPGQNYLSTTGTPEMKMWLDGFRTPEGKVRQYIFTEDKMKGVASQLIGKERVFAIGIAYYLSKDKKLYTTQRPEKRSSSNSYNIKTILSPDILENSEEYTQIGSSGFLGSPMSNTYGSAHNGEMDMSVNSLVAGQSCGNAENNANLNKTVLRTSTDVSAKQSIKPITLVKNLEIGAGALIKQRVYDDPKMVSYWESKPTGMIYINYCDEETKKKILEAGKRVDEKNGFMKGIKVGG